MYISFEKYSKIILKMCYDMPKNEKKYMAIYQKIKNYSKCMAICQKMRNLFEMYGYMPKNDGLCNKR